MKIGRGMVYCYLLGATNNIPTVLEPSDYKVILKLEALGVRLHSYFAETSSRYTSIPEHSLDTYIAKRKYYEKHICGY